MWRCSVSVPEASEPPCQGGERRKVSPPEPPSPLPKKAP